MQKPNIVIADLDGTIALIDHRRHWLDAERHAEMTTDERWRKFFAECVNDLPNWPVIWTLQALQRAGYYIHVFSGRSDEVREETIDWLEAFNVPYHHWRMRAAGDFTPDEELKRQWIAEYNLSLILCVFDDRQKVVVMWRSLGLACFQVAPGDF
jgi:hypothetical protein